MEEGEASRKYISEQHVRSDLKLNFGEFMFDKLKQRNKCCANIRGSQEMVLQPKDEDAQE